MVFPTIHTLESLAGYDSTTAILESFRQRPVPPILPRLVRTRLGASIDELAGACGEDYERCRIISGSVLGGRTAAEGRAQAR